MKGETGHSVPLDGNDCDVTDMEKLKWLISFSVPA